MGNALLVAERRGASSRAESLRFSQILGALPIDIDVSARPLQDAEALCELARDVGLSVYDAAYLELAATHGLPLATLDKSLAARSRRSGRGARRLTADRDADGQGTVLTVGATLREATARLRASGSRSPRLDAELLLSAALGVERIDLLRAPERALTADEARRFGDYVERRIAHEPVAYIRGRRAFRTLELEVTPAVLIPRPGDGDAGGRRAGGAGARAGAGRSSALRTARPGRRHGLWVHRPGAGRGEPVRARHGRGRRRGRRGRGAPQRGAPAPRRARPRAGERPARRRGPGRALRPDRQQPALRAGGRVRRAGAQRARLRAAPGAARRRGRPGRVPPPRPAGRPCAAARRRARRGGRGRRGGRRHRPVRGERAVRAGGGARRPGRDPARGVGAPGRGRGRAGARERRLGCGRSRTRAGA